MFALMLVNEDNEQANDKRVREDLQTSFIDNLEISFNALKHHDWKMRVTNANRDAAVSRNATAPPNQTKP